MQCMCITRLTECLLCLSTLHSCSYTIAARFSGGASAAPAAHRHAPPYGRAAAAAAACRGCRQLAARRGVHAMSVCVNSVPICIDTPIPNNTWFVQPLSHAQRDPEVVARLVQK